MGAKTWMLVYSDGDPGEALRRASRFDQQATLTLARTLFPQEVLEPVGEGDLSYTCPPDEELQIGCFPGVSVVAAKEFGIDRPSQLAPAFVRVGGAGVVTLHAMHSVVDWFAYARWENGRLLRALSLSPDSGIIEDIGSRLPFEEPYWSGAHPAVDDPDGEPYPFPFHPLELGEAALGALFGYRLEGLRDDRLFEPETVTLLRCRRARARSKWRLW